MTDAQFKKKVLECLADILGCVNSVRGDLPKHDGRVHHPINCDCAFPGSCEYPKGNWKLHF